MDYITSSGCIAGAGLHACARAVRLLVRQVGVAPEEAGGGVAREAVVTVAAGGVGGGVEDIPAFAARSPARAADESWPGLDHEAGALLSSSISAPCHWHGHEAPSKSSPSEPYPLIAGPQLAWLTRVS